MTTGIAVFLKYPEPGKVKTRLAATIGNERAAEAYVKMQRHVLDKVMRPLPEGFDVVLYGDPFVGRERYESYFTSYPFDKALQRGDDLGARLVTALGELLTTHGAAMAVGTDCVAMTPAHVTDAARRLERGADLVLGPAEDGGYYLIALKKAHPELFTEMAWSTDSVLRDTLARADQLRLRVEQLEMLPDIDTWEDWKKSGLT